MTNREEFIELLRSTNRTGIEEGIIDLQELGGSASHPEITPISATSKQVPQLFPLLYPPHHT